MISSYKVVETTQKGKETSLLGSGLLDNIKVVLGAGTYNVYAEIWDEAGAMTTYSIDPEFITIMPTQEQYESYDVNADVKRFKDVGDASRIAMILQADASIRKQATWLSLTDLAGDKTRDVMSDMEAENYDDLLRNLTNVCQYKFQCIKFVFI